MNLRPKFMIALIQRVTFAKVKVNNKEMGKIDQGILALIGIEKEDTILTAKKLCDRLLCYRIFPDEEDRMNCNLQEIGGGLLLVPQFTLVADTKKGTRPGFSKGASPTLGKTLFFELLDYAKASHKKVESGEFGADMQVTLCNDGPVTFWLKA